MQPQEVVQFVAVEPAGSVVDVLVLCHNCSVAEQNNDTSHMTTEQVGAYTAGRLNWFEVNKGMFLTQVGTLHMDHGRCQFCRAELSALGFGVVMAALEERS